MTHRGIEDRRHERLIEMAAEVVQVERQLRLLIEAAETFVRAAGREEVGGYWTVHRQNLEDRIETAKGHLA